MSADGDYGSLAGRPDSRAAQYNNHHVNLQNSAQRGGGSSYTVASGQNYLGMQNDRFLQQPIFDESKVDGNLSTW